VSAKRSSHEWLKRSSGIRQVSRNSRVNDALATISAITSSPVPITNAAAPSPPDCSRRPSGAPSRQSDIAASARLPLPAASAACSSAESPARTEPVRSAARLSAGNRAAAPTIAALSFSA
jgi:hypothetical protein